MSFEEGNNDLKMLPLKKRYRIKEEETTVEAMTEGRMPDKDSTEKSKIFPSVFRHTSCPNHSIGYLAREQPMKWWLSINYFYFWVIFWNKIKMTQSFSSSPLISLLFCQLNCWLWTSWESPSHLGSVNTVLFESLESTGLVCLIFSFNIYIRVNLTVDGK